MKSLIWLIACGLTAQDFKIQQAVGAKYEAAVYRGKMCLKVTYQTENEGRSFVVLQGSGFTDGVIEIDVAGDVVPGVAGGARGFSGIAFRMSEDTKSYEAFYLRPTNGRADDQERRNHSTQYISMPEYTWSRLRTETPSKYESYADLVPGEWMHMRIEVNGVRARLFVNGAKQPTLIVNDLKHGLGKGSLALWVGPGTIAHFAGLKVQAN